MQDSDCFNADLCDPIEGLCEERNLCGNGVMESGEFCEDGNSIDDDGCSSTCQIEFDSTCTATGQCESNNDCDLDGLAVCKVARGYQCTQDEDCFNSDLCDPFDQVCEERNTCGNGVLESEEFCDDGHLTEGDGCNSLCQIEFDSECSSLGQCEDYHHCDVLG